jgi:hypothetical protein
MRVRTWSVCVVRYLIRVVDAGVMELSQLSSLAQFVGAVGLVVLLPALQRLGVGRATLIALALLTTTIQMGMWASLSVPSVRHILGKAGYDALPYVINGAGIFVGVLMPCIRATIATLADTNAMKASVAVRTLLYSTLLYSTLLYNTTPTALPRPIELPQTHFSRQCHFKFR